MNHVLNCSNNRLVNRYSNRFANRLMIPSDNRSWNRSSKVFMNCIDLVSVDTSLSSWSDASLLTASRTSGINPWRDVRWTFHFNLSNDALIVWLHAIKQATDAAVYNNACQEVTWLNWFHWFVGPCAYSLEVMSMMDDCICLVLAWHYSKTIRRRPHGQCNNCLVYYVYTYILCNILYL